MLPVSGAEQLNTSEAKRDPAHLLRRSIAYSRLVRPAHGIRRPLRVRRHEHVPEAGGLGLLLQLLEDRDDLPALALGVLLAVDRHGGVDMLFMKFTRSSQ